MPGYMVYALLSLWGGERCSFVVDVLTSFEGELDMPQLPVSCRDVAGMSPPDFPDLLQVFRFLFPMGNIAGE